MKLGKLQERFTMPDTDFLRMYQNATLLDSKSFNETKATLQRVLTEADNYAKNNGLKYKYMQMAKAPLWETFEVQPRHFILKGFDAYVNIDMTESLDKMEPFVIVKNHNVEDLKNGQKIEITPEFVASLIPLQKEIFLESLDKVMHDATEILQKVWRVEQTRIDKWVKTCKIDLKGE